MFFVAIVIVSFSKKLKILEEEIREKKFNTLKYDAVVQKVSYYKNEPNILTIFPVHEK